MPTIRVTDEVMEIAKAIAVREGRPVSMTVARALRVYEDGQTVPSGRSRADYLEASSPPSGSPPKSTPDSTTTPSAPGASTPKSPSKPSAATSTKSPAGSPAPSSKKPQPPASTTSRPAPDPRRCLDSPDGKHAYTQYGICRFCGGTR